ncbi:MAG: AraC family transcriptional regulator [Cyanobacteria bacterium P01_G01_bin.54]
MRPNNGSCWFMRDRIVHAKDLLLSQLSAPPTLLKLAHQVGLNDRKLKQGFRQVFGTTVFGYLHNHRMTQAKQLLVLSGATIAGVAQQVGYRSPEAFSAAFRRTFEINPKAYQLQKR